jgi:hypothetical protein
MNLLLAETLPERKSKQKQMRNFRTFGCDNADKSGHAQ